MALYPRAYGVGFVRELDTLYVPVCKSVSSPTSEGQRRTLRQLGFMAERIKELTTHTAANEAIKQRIKRVITWLDEHGHELPAVYQGSYGACNTVAHLHKLGIDPPDIG
jgi:hypothetical protein